MTAAEMTAELQAQQRSGGRRKIYKAESDELRVEQIAADLNRKIDGLTETIRRPRVDLNDLQEVQSRTLEYLTACRDSGVIPTVSTYAVMGMGLTRQRLNRYIAENPDSPSSYFMEQVKDLFSATLETGALSHTIDSIMSIFILKNDHNRADRVQLEAVQTADPLGTAATQAELEAKLQDIVFDDWEDTTDE